MEIERTELVFILDKSGSMSGLEQDTIGGFNSMLAKQQAEAGGCRLTTVLFDHDYVLLHDRLGLETVSKLTAQDYQVGGMTALLDAIGQTIQRLVTTQKQTIKTERASKVLFVIMTDGAENSSREYTLAKVKSLINEQKELHGWEFIFLGANIDAVKTAGSLGITPDHAVDYLADGEGTQLSYQVMAQSISQFRELGRIDEANFDAIRKDVQNRRGN